MWFFQRKSAHRPVIAGCRPKGKWARASLPEPLVGTGLLGDEIAAFARAARQAEARGRRYGLKLEIDEDPEGAPVGIRVHGAVVTTGYLRARHRVWPLGVLAGDLAAQAARDYIVPGIPLAAELVSLDDSGAGDPVVAVALLVPPVHAPPAAPSRRRTRLQVVR